jgi:hypothetical protein
MASTLVNQILLGLFGGAGATLLWEVLLKPLRERRSVAEVLAAEISLNLQLLGAVKLYARPDKVPPDSELSTMAFDAIAEKVGELPPQTVAEVIFVYRYFKQLSSLPKYYSQFITDLRSTPSDAPHRATIEQEIRGCVAVFNSHVEKAIVRINITQPLLLKVAFPWWSPRKFQREPSRDLDLRELAERIRASEAERAKLSDDIRRRSQG